MSQITLFCEETPGLKLGPGTTSSFADGRPPGDVIVFFRGFATFEADDYPDWERWVRAPGTPYIRVVDVEAGEATSADAGVACPICSKPFATEKSLNGHLLSHRRKGEMV